MLPLKTRRLRAGTILHRIHRLTHSPIFFGPSGAKPEQRYDDPDGAYKVLYLARALETSFGETLVRNPAVSDVLSTDVLIRARSELVLARTLRLYPLNDAGLSAHGLKLPDVLGDNYARTWTLSAYVHAQTDADGILYISRINGGECVVLFDRASDAIAPTGVTSVPLTPELAADLAATFGKHYAEP